MLDLWCLPCAGASATMYLRWRRLLPHWVNLVPVELPGRGARMGEPPASRFDALVEQLCSEWPAPRDDRAWVLFGHSMGALLAHGIVRRFQALKQPLPHALVVSASAAPSRRDPSRFAGKDDDRALIADLRRQGGTPAEVFECPELLRSTLDTLAADYRVCASFVHRTGPALPLPVHAFGGLRDEIAAADVMAWREESAAAFSHHGFDGGHFFIREHELPVVHRLVHLLQPLHEHSTAATS